MFTVTSCSHDENHPLNITFSNHKLTPKTDNSLNKNSSYGYQSTSALEDVMPIKTLGADLSLELPTGLYTLCNSLRYQDMTVTTTSKKEMNLRPQNRAN